MNLTTENLNNAEPSLVAFWQSLGSPEAFNDEQHRMMLRSNPEHWLWLFENGFSGFAKLPGENLQRDRIPLNSSWSLSVIGRLFFLTGDSKYEAF